MTAVLASRWVPRRAVWCCAAGTTNPGDLGQLGHQPVSFLGQLDPDDPRIVGVRAPAHETRCLRAIHQPHCAVALQQEVIRQLSHGWRPVAGMALDRHQQLMLDVCQADRGGLILAPALEAPQRDAKG